ncbi:MAG: response regulator [Candidatus Obscuribacterales bacterium]|nr:response regulator [Cyanobacteria bacterium HKST-UBA01]MCB9467403.1 response regulator [Candidatus Obscuribacterales bacterium]
MAKVLVVEDDEFLQELLAECIETCDHSVVKAGTGKDALEQIAGGEFDVILLDWQLPDMEGISILEQYRSGDGKAKVVMLTGMRDKADEVIKLGADEFLAKPFKMHEVLNMLERVTT